MSFLKAIQHTNPEAYFAYKMAMERYREECRIYHKIRKLYKDSENSVEQLRFYKAKERFSAECKVFKVAEEKYVRAQATKQIEAKGLDISTLTLKQIAEVDIPTGHENLTKAELQEQALNIVSEEQLELIKKLAYDKDFRRRFLQKADNELAGIHEDILGTESVPSPIKSSQDDSALFDDTPIEEKE